MGTSAGSFSMTWRESSGSAGDSRPIEYEEVPGSYEVNVTPSGITATRTIRIAWDRIWDFIAGIGYYNNLDYRTWYNQSLSAIKFPKFPGRQENPNSPTTPKVASSDPYGCDLVITNVNIAPTHDGRQKGISTETDSGGIVSYERADIILEYTQRNHPKLMNRMQSGISTMSAKDDNTWYDDDEPVTTPIPYLESVTEIICSYTSHDLDINRNTPVGAIAPSGRLGGGTDLLIATQTNLDNARGKVNKSPVTLFFGRDKKRFSARTILFTDYEIEPIYNFGRFGQQYTLRLQVSPAFTIDETDGFVTRYGWDYLYDIESRTYRQLTNSPYKEIEMNATDSGGVLQLVDGSPTHIFPYQWGSGLS